MSHPTEPQQSAAAPDVHIIDSSKMSRHTETKRNAAAPDTVEISTPFPSFALS